MQRRGPKRARSRRAAGTRGSLTIEAALTLPLLLLVTAGFLTLFSFLAAEVKIQAAMDRVGGRIAAGYYGIEKVRETKAGEQLAQLAGIPVVSDAVSAAAVKALVTDEMEGHAAGEEIIAGGTVGILFWGSGYDEETKDVTVRASYGLKIPFLPFAGLVMPVTQQTVCRAFVGQELSQREEEQEVYVTENGKVYHTALSCTYLKLSIREVSLHQVGSLRNADGGRYYACEACGEGTGDRVFITDYGDCFHFNRNCVGLKRGIRSIPISQAGALPECSRCRAREGNGS